MCVCVCVNNLFNSRGVLCVMRRSGLRGVYTRYTVYVFLVVQVFEWMSVSCFTGCSVWAKCSMWAKCSVWGNQFGRVFSLGKVIGLYVSRLGGSVSVGGLGCSRWQISISLLGAFYGYSMFLRGGSYVCRYRFI